MKQQFDGSTLPENETSKFASEKKGFQKEKNLFSEYS
jgi:hypothetical protein